MGVAVCTEAVDEVVVKTAVDSGIFMKLCMELSYLLLVFALEYKLFLISFARRQTPQSL